ncbi:Na(+)/H(+) antiporter subunit C [Janibacter melonis]|uniref:Na(+)/H(+) antiporter subunit C n=1 Tax=Janibacter melonis TaxID=262209 RepID=A0A5P8FLF6_9MICO|nr:Na(+)/H(+) antiporter subunit C [Janibacter melonis]MCB5992848.1 Na(+)/H(+) antiporter subunit C [Janibacter melonis]QFQ29754.2 Na(+)/H(+) antiporter subunit C [Janibacter melonis]
MTVNLTLVLATMILVGCGVYLMLERSLTRVLVGLVMLSNGVNLGFLVVSGPSGRPPLVDRYDVSEISDPLPQAFVLTAIVITLGTTAFLLAMAYRSWQLSGNDDVKDDVEDAAIRRLAHEDQMSDGYDLAAGETTDDALEVFDEEGDEPEGPDHDGAGPRATAQETR